MSFFRGNLLQTLIFASLSYLSSPQPTVTSSSEQFDANFTGLLQNIKQELARSSGCNSVPDVSEFLAALRRDVTGLVDAPSRGRSSSCGDDIIGRLDAIRDELSALRSSLGGAARPFQPSGDNRTTSAQCFIDIVSYGCKDGPFAGGHIRTNWIPVHTFSTPGYYLALIDPVTCTGTPFPVTVPYSGGAPATTILISYINLVSKGQILVGATGCDARNNIDAAFPVFASIGVNVTRLETFGKLAFVVQKGSPEKSVSAVGRLAGGNQWLVVNVEGSSTDDISFTRLNP